MYVYNVCGLSTDDSLPIRNPADINIQLCIGKENLQPGIPVKPVQWYFFFPSARKCADRRRVNVTRHSLGLKTIFVCIIIIVIIYYYKRITSMTDAIASYILDFYYSINHPAVHLYTLQTICIIYGIGI